jgi:hypothetical protein
MLSALLCLLLAPTSLQGGGEPPVLTAEELRSLSDRISEEVAELRGLDFRQEVELEVLDASGVRTWVEELIGRDYTTEDIAGEQDMARLLGMLAPDLDLRELYLDLMEDQVLGLYDPVERVFAVSSSAGSGVLRMTLAHELTHALDDQHHGLARLQRQRDGNGDAQLAFHCVAEGSGLAVMNAWMKGAMQRGELSMKELMALQEKMKGLDEVPDYLWRPLLASYYLGSSFLVRSDRLLAGQLEQPAFEDVERAFTDPPRSTEQVLHPERYWDSARVDEPRNLDVVGEPAEGWTVRGEDTLGELGLGIVTLPLERRGGLTTDVQMKVASLKFTHGPSEGWDGDRWVLLAKDEARVLLHASVWDTVRDATEFEQAMTGLSEHVTAAASAVGGGTGGLHVSSDGDSARLLVFAGVDRETAEAAVAGLSFASSEVERPESAPAGAQ